MKQKSKPFDKSRRRFLSGAAAAGVGGALTAALPAATAVADAAEETLQSTKAKGYQLTQHVLDYYKSAAS
ncbi:MAG: formate dehydrogenase [Chromatiaceae bacterium]|nr:formate dehydrogenase [Chromatiaceae bacterium]